MIQVDLSSRCVLITGGASGIGLSTARLFARMGARVAINDVSHQPLEAAAHALKDAGDVICIAGDVGDQQDARRIVAETTAGFGRLDYLINNAGTASTTRPIPPAELDAVSEEMWSQILSVNLVGPFRMTQAAADQLRANRGAVVNTASTAAFSYPGSSLAYAASKAGLVNLTTSLARALAPEARVNAVAPGLIQTPWTARFGAEWEERTVARTALQRAGTPDDIAEVILFLCAGAGYVTGQTIRVDGGLT